MHWKKSLKTILSLLVFPNPWINPGVKANSESKQTVLTVYQGKNTRLFMLYLSCFFLTILISNSR